MKTFLFHDTAKGNKVLISIGDASIDPLETRNNGIKHAKKSPKYAELTARIKTYNDYLEKCKAEGIRFSDPDNVPSKVKADLRNRLLVVSGLQDDLMEIKKKYEDENPVYMLAASSMLVDDQVVDDIALADTEGKVIVLRTGKGGKYAGYDLISNNVGNKYRLEDSTQWVYLKEPDEEIPTGARLGDPDEVELRSIEAARVRALPAQGKESEKAANVKAAKNQYSLDIIAADLEASPEAIDEAKADARAQYDARLKDIETLFV